MLEVVAKLCGGRSVLLAGETLECQVTLTNNPHHARKSSPYKCKSVKLAWASAQIHCQCSVSESKVILPKSPIPSTADVTTSGNETAFVPSKGEKGSTVMYTKPHILICDLTLAPGESQTFTYCETLPLEAPPSFRGTAVKYSYKVTIGTQRLGCPTRLLRLPFRVMVVPGLNDISVYEESEEAAPSNPFLACQRKPDTGLMDVAMEILQTITARKAPNFYNITNSNGRVARFCLFRQAYRIGDDIVGSCDFTDCNVPCVQFSVTLQSEEIINGECVKKQAQSSSTVSYSKHSEFCLHMQRTHIAIPIPLTSTPAFCTDIVSLKWRLHFEFVTGKDKVTCPARPVSPSQGSNWQGPSELRVETMIWDLPIKVFATNPVYASAVSLLKTHVGAVV